MNSYFLMDEVALSETIGGEAITLTAIIGVCVLALVCIAVIKMFQVSKGKLALPGGFTIEWTE